MKRLTISANKITPKRYTAHHCANISGAMKLLRGKSALFCKSYGRNAIAIRIFSFIICQVVKRLQISYLTCSIIDKNNCHAS